MADEVEKPEPRTAEDWQKLIDDSHLWLFASRSGQWGVDIITPGYTWTGHLEFITYAKGEKFDTVFHTRQDKAIAKGRKRIAEVRDFFERSKQNGRIDG